MLEVKFHEQVDDNLLEVAVIMSKHNGEWVFCKHKDRNTYECPGGHREDGEEISDTARRELWEETGAISFDITPVCAYSVLSDTYEYFGMLYFADIYEFQTLPGFEMEKAELFHTLPTEWTHPLIQPHLLKKIETTMQVLGK